MEEPRLGGENLSAVGTEKLVRTLPLLSEKGEAETSPRSGAGVVIILSDYLVLYSHYDQQHLVLTVGPKPEDRYVTNDPCNKPNPQHSPTETPETSVSILSPSPLRSRPRIHRSKLAVCPLKWPQTSQVSLIYHRLTPCTKAISPAL